MYIIHMFALYAGAAIILPLEIPVFWKFVLINMFTGLVCYVIYEFIIKRINLLRPLFGLKWKVNKESKTQNLTEAQGSLN